jgi:alcohol dehydrogenase
VAVHGCGGVGLSAIMIAAALGARVVGIDVSDEALAAARKAGAEATLRAGGEPAGDLGGGPSEEVRAVTAGGAHLSIDAIGAEAAVAASVAGLRKRGRHVQVGLLPDPPRVPMDLVIARELELLGSHGMAARAYPELLALVETGRLRPGDLVTREIGLDEAPAALTAMGEPRHTGVTVIRP